MLDSVKTIIEQIKEAKKNKNHEEYRKLLDQLENEQLDYYKLNLKTDEKFNLEKAIENDFEELKKIKEIQEEDLEVVNSNISTILDLYKDIMPFNKMGDMALTFLQECMQKMVIYNEPDFFSDFAKYNIKDNKIMANLCYAIRNISYSHVRNRLSPTSAEKQTKTLFDFSESCANMYKTLYELNYDKITMNVIMSKINKEI